MSNDKIREALEHLENWQLHGFDEMAEAALGCLKAAHSIEEKREWISCKEQLPTRDDADCEGNLWCLNGAGVGLWRWEVVNTSPHDWGVTHWTPTGLTRPAPPETGEVQS
ncbi:hypothetical protein [Microbulbifer sp. SAOS-129_SWC]|uniref:hypothetical protein n=1 Tax=Microbulbifer sp. SAOS-129_SWC TaxID=3145235 RepID=UPI003216E774